jgi:hypothetical protein
LVFGGQLLVLRPVELQLDGHLTVLTFQGVELQDLGFHQQV